MEPVTEHPSKTTVYGRLVATPTNEPQGLAPVADQPNDENPETATQAIEQESKNSDTDSEFDGFSNADSLPSLSLFQGPEDQPKPSKTTSQVVADPSVQNGDAEEMIRKRYIITASKDGTTDTNMWADLSVEERETHENRGERFIAAVSDKLSLCIPMRKWTSQTCWDQPTWTLFSRYWCVAAEEVTREQGFEDVEFRFASSQDAERLFDKQDISREEWDDLRWAADSDVLTLISIGRIQDIHGKP